MIRFGYEVTDITNFKVTDLKVQHLEMLYGYFGLLKSLTMFRSSHWRCSIKKMFLEISQNSQKTPVPESPFFSRKACNFIKKETLAQVFSCEFCEISKNKFFTEHLFKRISCLVFFHAVQKSGHPAIKRCITNVESKQG